MAAFIIIAVTYLVYHLLKYFNMFLVDLTFIHSLRGDIYMFIKTLFPPPLGRRLVLFPFFEKSKNLKEPTVKNLMTNAAVFLMGWGSRIASSR